MWKNEHELESTFFFFTQDRNKELNTHDLELGHTTPFNDTQFMKII